MKKMMKERLTVKIYDTRQSMGQAAAREVSEKIRELLSQKEEVNMIFAAAPSQNEFLACLATDREIDWSRINAFHMDEYIGLDPEASQGFGNFLRDRLFGKVPLKSVHYLNGNAGDVQAECRRYSELLKAGPTDIVCMGIGENGHIAFNDPHVAKFNDAEMVKVVELDVRCRQQQVNDGCFKTLDEVPQSALTLTVPALFQCDCIYCMVPGKTKAEAVYNTITGEVTEKCPASILQTHKNAVLYIDSDSGRLVIQA
jgi:glucosamine-6-phosphate deaminase